MESYTVTATGEGTGSLFQVNAGGNSITIDSKEGGTALRPLDALLAGVAACVGVYVRFFCSKKQIDLKGVSVTVRSELVKERPLRFADIKISIDLRGTVVDEPTRSALMDFVKNCPAHGTLKNSPNVSFEFL